MMYYLFKYKNITPSSFYSMKSGEKRIVYAFIKQEIEDRNKENEALT